MQTNHAGGRCTGSTPNMRQRWRAAVASLGIGAGLLAAAAYPASANTVHWTFSATTFYDGTPVTGFFNYDSSSPSLIGDYTITVQPGSSSYGAPLVGFNFTPANSQANWDPYDYIMGVQTPYSHMGASVSFLYFAVVDWRHLFNPAVPGTDVFAPLSGNWGYEALGVWPDYVGQPSNLLWTTRYLDALTLTSPSASIPEPAGAGVLLGGIACLSLLRRRAA